MRNGPLSIIMILSALSISEASPLCSALEKHPTRSVASIFEKGPATHSCQILFRNASEYPPENEQGHEQVHAQLHAKVENAEVRFRFGNLLAKFETHDIQNAIEAVKDARTHGIQDSKIEAILRSALKACSDN